MSYDFSTQTTWTPVVNIGGAITGITYSTQYGYYMLQGNVVILTYNVVLTSKGALSGAITITGLPYTCASGADFYASNLSIVHFTVTTNYVSPSHAVLSGTNYISLFQTASARSIIAVSNTNVADNSSFQGELFYFI